MGAEVFSGEPVRLEVDTSSASGGVTFTIYPMGSATARTLLATEYLSITDILVDMLAAGTLKIVQDTDAAGHLIFKGTFGADPNANTLTHHFATPICCGVGLVPKLFAPKGVATAVMCGLITQG
jgi:hypothetical protein